MTVIILAYTHQATCPCSPAPRSSACQGPKPDIRIFSTFVPRHAKEVTILLDGDTLLDGVPSQSPPDGGIIILFGFDVTSEVHPAFSGARTHSSIAEMTALKEALSCFEPLLSGSSGHHRMWTEMGGRSKEERKAVQRGRAMAARRARTVVRTGTKQARQASGFWR